MPGPRPDPFSVFGYELCVQQTWTRLMCEYPNSRSSGSFLHDFKGHRFPTGFTNPRIDQDDALGGGGADGPPRQVRDRRSQKHGWKCFIQVSLQPVPKSFPSCKGLNTWNIFAEDLWSTLKPEVMIIRPCAELSRSFIIRESRSGGETSGFFPVAG